MDEKLVEEIEKRKELERQIALDNRLKKEREEADKIYAVKLVEKVVYAFFALIATSVVIALLKVAIEYINVHFSK